MNDDSLLDKALAKSATVEPDAGFVEALAFKVRSRAARRAPWALPSLWIVTLAAMLLITLLFIFSNPDNDQAANDQTREELETPSETPDYIELAPARELDIPAEWLAEPHVDLLLEDQLGKKPVLREQLKELGETRGTETLGPNLPEGFCDQDLVVHEWGVIILDAKGAKQSSRLIKDLPDFIKDGEPADYQPSDMVECLKPIIYFYPKQKTVTEFRPTVAATFAGGKPVYSWPVAATDGENLIWPSDYFGLAVNGKRARPVDKGHWIDIARDTDALWLTFNNETERFLFYDGEINYSNPFKVTLVDETLKLENIGKDPVFDAWYLELLGDRQLRVVAKTKLEGAKTTIVDPSASQKLSSTDACAMLSNTLQEAGLFKKEADGMAKIWQSTFFERKGRWLLWRLSPETLEKALPLTIAIGPDRKVDIVRIMLVMMPVDVEPEERK